MNTEAITAYTPEIKTYLKAVGIHPVTDLDLAIRETFGRQEGKDRIFRLDVCFDAQEERLSRPEKQNAYWLRDPKLLDEIYESMEMASVCAGFYDWYVFRRVMERMCRYPELFRGDVLDVGCGNGVISCFAARHYPEASFVGTDVHAGALRISENVRSLLKLGNMRFLQPEAMGTQRFYTVLSVRVMAGCTGQARPGQHPGLSAGFV